MIVVDTSALVSAALKAESVPELALLRAEAADGFALSSAVEREYVAVLTRPKFAQVIPSARRHYILDVLRGAAVWFEPAIRVTDCRDGKDNKYLELALASGADAILTGDADLPILHPWRGVNILSPSAYLGGS